MKGLPCKSHGETVKTVLMSLVVYDTGLKPGVNEKQDSETFEAKLR